MEVTEPNQLAAFIELIDRYNESFYSKDIELFRSLHVEDNGFVFFDNHAGCDSDEYSTHEEKVNHFFESGSIVELTKDNIRVFHSNEMACITLTLRYSKTPKPGVRTTIVVELVERCWKIRHMHHSFDPNETVVAK